VIALCITALIVPAIVIAQSSQKQSSTQNKNKTVEEVNKIIEPKKQPLPPFPVGDTTPKPIVQPKPVVVPYRAPVAPTGTCADWMRLAGITDPGNAIILINRESGCNPNAVNRSSGACGIGQQLPCGKWPHAWNDPVGGMIDMQSYVMARYGSWANAVAFSTSHGWY